MPTTLTITPLLDFRDKNSRISSGPYAKYPSLPSTASRPALTPSSSALDLMMGENGQLRVPSSWEELRSAKASLGVGAEEVHHEDLPASRATTTTAGGASWEAAPVIESLTKTAPAVAAAAASRKRRKRQSGVAAEVNDEADGGRHRATHSSPARGVSEELRGGDGHGGEAEEAEEAEEALQLPSGGGDAAQWAEALTRLQEQVTRLKSQLANATRGRDRIQEQLRKLQSKFTDTQRRFASAMREKEAAVEREKLEMEQRFSHELAEAMNSQAKANSSGASGAADSSAPAKELLNTIESLHERYARAEKAWADAKAAAEEQTRRSVAAAEAKHLRELSAANGRAASLEDRIGSLQQQMTSLMKDASVAQKREDAAQAAANAARRESAALQREVSSMKDQMEALRAAVPPQLRAAQQGFSGTSSLGGSGDGTSASSAANETVPAAVLESVKATTSARIRQLSNEVQYLKAQLASEVKRMVCVCVFVTGRVD